MAPFIELIGAFCRCHGTPSQVPGTRSEPQELHTALLDSLLAHQIWSLPPTVHKSVQREALTCPTLKSNGACHLLLFPDQHDARDLTGGLKGKSSQEWLEVMETSGCCEPNKNRLWPGNGAARL